jgi:hypothetical protein
LMMHGTLEEDHLNTILSMLDVSAVVPGILKFPKPPSPL